MRCALCQPLPRWVHAWQHLSIHVWVTAQFYTNKATCWFILVKLVQAKEGCTGQSLYSRATALRMLSGHVPVPCRGTVQCVVCAWQSRVHCLHVEVHSTSVYSMWQAVLRIPFGYMYQCAVAGACTSRGTVHVQCIACASSVHCLHVEVQCTSVYSIGVCFPFGEIANVWP